MMFRTLFPNSGIWIQSSGATGYVSSEICFSKIFERHWIEFKIQDGKEFHQLLRVVSNTLRQS